MQERRIYLTPATAWMLLLLFLAVALRFVLLQDNWPMVNADESIMDLMARHILYQGDHPIFFWGQHYMGTLQAYLGAGLIQFFGSFALSVRLGTLLLFALYLVCLYFLVRLLYTPIYALFICALLSLGSDRIMSIPLVANGGYAETMLLSVAIFLLVAYLASTISRSQPRMARSRLLLYLFLGVLVGLSLWSDQLILSALLAAGLLLWFACRRELTARPLLALVLGVLSGALPLLLYNLTAPPLENSLFVLLGTVFSGAPRVLPFSEQLAHALLISLPLATGLPFSSGLHTVCGTVEPYTQSASSLAALFPGSNPWLCLGTRGGWSLGLLVLWGLALAGVLLTLKREQRAFPTASLDERTLWNTRVRLQARLMLLGSAALWFVLFACSAAAEYTPRASCRYLICLLIATPAVLWPLWSQLGAVKRAMTGQRFLRSRALLSGLALLVIVATYLVGTGDIFANVPAAQESYNQTSTLVQTLLVHQATEVYANYDLCSLLMFQSSEQLTCGVLDDQLQPGVNRYTPYLMRVQAAAHPAYLFPLHSAPDQALALRMSRDTHYQHMVIGMYSLYYYTV